MNEIEIPNYFICPISLQIMKDPVTVVTGITYDRDSIEHWLFTTRNNTCPVTKQPLPRDSDLTPNHTLRRLIQAWCTENASLGVDRIPTPKPSLDRFYVRKLLKDLEDPKLQMKTLRQLDLFAAENERNRSYMAEAAVPKAMISFIITCFKEGRVDGLEEALSIFQLIRISPAETKLIFSDQYNHHIIESLTWVLGCEFRNHLTIKSHAVLVLKSVVENSKSSFLERLKPELFEQIMPLMRQDGSVTQEGLKAALHLLLHVCPWNRNRRKMIENGAVSTLLDLELGQLERRSTELVLGILFHLCSCADGRAQFLAHKGSIAAVKKRIMRVSAVADDRAILILLLISRFSRTKIVSEEMLKVGVAAKLCMVLQNDCATYLKDKAMEILRLHSDVWKDSPEIDRNVLTRYIKGNTQSL
ncbi:hypothetical protein SLA2020_213640 [Shorea laevis]